MAPEPVEPIERASLRSNNAGCARESRAIKWLGVGSLGYRAGLAKAGEQIFYIYSAGFALQYFLSNFFITYPSLANDTLPINDED